MKMNIPFLDLSFKYSRFKQAFHNDLDAVLTSGQFILGHDVEALEDALSEMQGCSSAITVANGTDALVLALKGMNVKNGDEVITTPMSYLASTSAITMLGAKPIFADVDDSLNLAPDSVITKITERTKAILVVHLAGVPADVPSLRAIAQKYKLGLVEDCAQAFGAQIDGKAVGTFSDVSAVSFHPLKNLGTLGDGGVIFCNRPELQSWFLKARNHGHSSRNECDFWSINSRLDALHARFIMSQLGAHNAEIARRRELADLYRDLLLDCVKFPTVRIGYEPSYNWIMILAEQRDELMLHLAKSGIETKVHYPKLIPELSAASNIDCDPQSYPNAIKFTQQILSLPCAEHITTEHVHVISQKILEFYRSRYGIKNA